MDREEIMYLIKYAGILFSLALAMVLVMAFTVAYFNPSKTVTITINKFGEADFEFFLIWLIVMPTIIAGYLLVYRQGITADVDKQYNLKLPKPGIPQERLRYEESIKGT